MASGIKKKGTVSDKYVVYTAGMGEGFVSVL